MVAEVLDLGNDVDDLVLLELLVVDVLLEVRVEDVVFHLQQQSLRHLPTRQALSHWQLVEDRDGFPLSESDFIVDV